VEGIGLARSTPLEPLLEGLGVVLPTSASSGSEWPSKILPSSQTLWSFQPSQAETRHIAAASSSWSTVCISSSDRPVEMIEPITIAKLLTMLLAATVRAASLLCTVVVRNA
jgi:hypothetical protein